MVGARRPRTSGRGGSRSRAVDAQHVVDRPVELREISVDQIQVPRRPARRFLGDVASLAASMQAYGLQQPISVRQDADQYILTSGLRRLTAARTLGWPTIPAFVRGVSADDAYLIDLVENLQREDLSPEEEADALGELVRTRGWTLDQVAEAVKRSQGYVSKRVRLFEDPALREAVVHGGLAVSTAELILGAPAEQRSVLIERATAEGWDQMRVRDELQRLQSRPLPDLKQRRKSVDASLPTRDGRAISRPPNFTRKVREFHRTILDIKVEDLTPADRSALRTLFKALQMLGRARTTPSAPVFPALPQVKASVQRAHASPRRKSR